MSLVSQQQPWHPAWSRQWVPQSTMQNDAGLPKAPANWQWSTCSPTDIKHVDRRGMIYLSSACRRCKCYLPQPQALILALWLRGPALPHDRTVCKNKRTGWHKGSGRMEATATTTHGGGSTCSGVRGEDRQIGCFQDKKEGDSVHSTLSTKKKWKRVGWIMPPKTFGCESLHQVISLNSRS